MAIVQLIAAGDTDVAIVQTGTAERLLIQLVNSVANLTAFKIYVRAGATAPWHLTASAAADYTGAYTAPLRLLEMASNATNAALDISTLSSSSSAYILMRVRGIDSVKLVAAGAGAILTVYSSMY